MPKKDKIFDELDRIAPLIPIPIYWLDTNLKIAGANELCLTAVGSDATVSSFIGLTYYDYYPKEIADELTKMVGLVLKKKQTIKVEEKIVDVTTGKFRYYETVRAPLFGANGKIVGTICTAVEITDKRETENLRIKALEQKSMIDASKKFQQFSNDLYNLMQSYQYDFLNDELGKSQKSSSINSNIKLSKREKEILYYLALNQSPKEIANILSTLENKPVTTATIQATINKGLYSKFDVCTVSQMIEKANSLKLIPFVLEKSTN